MVGMCGRDQDWCGSFMWHSVRREVEATSMCEHYGGMTKFSKAKFRTHYLAVMNVFIMIKIMLQKYIILTEYQMIENIWNDLVLVERPIRPVKFFQKFPVKMEKPVRNDIISRDLLLERGSHSGRTKRMGLILSPAPCLRGMCRDTPASPCEKITKRRNLGVQDHFCAEGLSRRQGCRWETLSALPVMIRELYKRAVHCQAQAFISLCSAMTSTVSQC